MAMATDANGDMGRFCVELCIFVSNQALVCQTSVIMIHNTRHRGTRGAQSAT